MFLFCSGDMFRLTRQGSLRPRLELATREHVPSESGLKSAAVLAHHSLLVWQVWLQPNVNGGLKLLCLEEEGNETLTRSHVDGAKNIVPIAHDKRNSWQFALALHKIRHRPAITDAHLRYHPKVLTVSALMPPFATRQPR